MYYIQLVIFLFMVASYTAQLAPEVHQKHQAKTIDKEPVEVESKVLVNKNIPKIPSDSPSDNQKQDIQVTNSNLTIKGASNTSTTSATTNIGNQSSGNVNNIPKKNGSVAEEKTIELESGAITRGILVFVGIGFFFILYVGLRTYRRKKQDKSRTIVRKYGIRTTRADLEMEPLPLSDDDEDETLFDLTASRPFNR